MALFYYALTLPLPYWRMTLWLDRVHFGLAATPPKGRR